MIVSTWVKFCLNVEYLQIPIDFYFRGSGIKVTFLFTSFVQITSFC